LLAGLAAAGTIPGWAKTNNGTWSKAADMLEEHVGHTATLLADGRVLVAGGTNAGDEAVAACEIFHPKINRWTRAASMRNARAGHSATLLASGEVLVVGGRTGSYDFLDTDFVSAEIYHPSSNRWTPAASPHAAHVNHTAIRLRDNRVLIVGGFSGFVDSTAAASNMAQAEIYDPGRDAWSLAGSGLRALDERTATLMPDGSVLTTGGFTGMEFATTDAELFDPRTNGWHPATWPLADARYGHTATLLPDGRVLLVGGYTTQRQTVGGFVYPNNELVLPSEIYDLRGNTLVRVAPFNKTGRFEHTATLLRTGTVLVVGSAYVSNADSQLFDPMNTENWISTGMRMDRYLHTATLLGDGRVLIAGGYGIGSPKTAWIYSPVSVVGQASTPISLLQIGEVLLLFALITVAVAAMTRRLPRWRKNAAEPQREWIDPD